MKSISYLLEIKDKFSLHMNKFVLSTGKAFKAVSRLNGALMATKNTVRGLRALSGGYGSQVGGVLGAYYTLKSFTDFETAMYKVAKTANIDVGSALDSMGKQFKVLSESMPNTADELALVGASAAQLGVRGEKNILKFAKTMGMLESATNVYGEEGSSQLARLINVVGGDIGNVDRYASALTHLGNTSAATEREILRFATDMASRSQAFNITGQDAMGLAAAFKSVGLQSELASGAVSRVLGIMNEAIYSGGDALVVMSGISGKTREELKEAFETDAVGALVSLGDSIEDLESKGVNLTKALSHLGLEGLRDKVVMTTLAKKIDLVKESMAKSNKEFSENKALLKEYEVQTQTLANRMKTALGAFKLVLIAIVDKFDDKLKYFLDKAKDKFIALADYIEKTTFKDMASQFGEKIKDSLIWAFNYAKPYIEKVMEFAAEAFIRGVGSVLKNYESISSTYNVIKNTESFFSKIWGFNKLGNFNPYNEIFGTSRPQSQSVELNGNITVSADKGSSVSTSNFGISGNRGRILQTVGVNP